MFSFLKLIRIQNLLIIAFTQYMVRWCIVYPMLVGRGYELQLSNFHFFLLALSTVMIAAAGYIINDYFDVNIDKINKPERMVIDKGVKRRVAIGAHTVINILAILIGLYISYLVGEWKLILIYLFWTFGLWFYSTHFKRQFLSGNLMIALFVALVPLVAGVYELLPCYKTYAVSFRDIWKYIFAISFFAFISTLLREMIKDIEDYEGDKEYGCQTMPIVIGIKASKMVIVILSFTTFTCLSYFQIFFWKTNDFISFIYFGLALQVPFLFLIWKTITATTKKDFRIAGNTAKVIMLLGVCYLFIFAYTILSYIHAI
jgi:4-hydroxybenzoate polyprenyltransferase